MKMILKGNVYNAMCEILLKKSINSQAITKVHFWVLGTNFKDPSIESIRDFRMNTGTGRLSSELSC